MAFELATAYVSLVPSAKGITTGISQAVDRETPGIQKKLSGTFKAVALGAGAAFAAIKIGGFLKDAIGEFQESAKVGRLTEQVIKSTGGAAHVTAGQVGELANSLAAKTGIDDEVIQSGENVLATFTNVRNEVGAGNDIFNQATVAATNMSAALGQDMQSSVIQLGKALNDPIKGITALSRVGVSFTEQQKEQIATLVQSGDVLGAQKVILGELSKEFGGAAAAAADPLAQLQVAIGNFKESIGKGLFPVVQQITPVLGGVLASLGPALGTALGGLVQGLQPLIDALGPFLTTLGGALGTLLSGLTPVANAFATALAAMAPSLGTVAQAVAPLIAGFGQLLGSLAPLLGPFEAAWALIVQTLSGALVPVLGALTGALTPIVQALLPPLHQALQILAPVLARVGSIIGGVLVGAINQLAPVLAEIVPVLGGAFVEAIKAIAPVLPDLARSFVELVTATTPFVIQVLPPLARLLAVLVPPLAKVIAFVLRMKVAFDGIQIGIIRGIADALGKIVVAVANFEPGDVIGWLKNLGNAVAKLPDLLGDLGSKLLELGTSALKGLLDGLVSALPDVVTFFVELPGKILGAGFDFAAAFVPKGLELLGGLLTGLLQALPSVLEFIALLPFRILGLLVLGAILIPKGLELLGGFLLGLIVKLPEVVTFFVSLPGKILGWIGSLVATLVPKGLQAIGGLLSGLVQRIPAVAEFLASIPGKLPGWIGNAAGALVDIGKDIMRGLRDGIDAGIGWVKDALHTVVDKIKDAVTDPLGIFSPSRVFRGYGENLMEGLTLGISAKGSQPTRALGKVVSSLARAKLDVAISARAPIAFDVPQLATGGIVQRTPSGTLALLGEGRHDEAVIPLPRLSELFKDFEAGGRTSNTVINVTALKPGTPLARDIADELAWDAKTNGRD